MYVRAQTRHRLKEDRFSRATIGAAEATVHWSEEHKAKLIIGALILAVVLATGFGGWGTPAEPDLPSFASTKERSTEARKQLQSIADQYPHTRTAEFARYFLGLTSSQLGDNAAAERDLKAVAGTHNEDLAALAKLGLAAVYRDTNRTKGALDLYNQLIAKPTRSVGKVTAQMELAEMYASTQQPAEAKRVYEQMQKENPASEVAQFATQKLQQLK